MFQPRLCWLALLVAVPACGKPAPAPVPEPPPVAVAIVEPSIAPAVPDNVAPLPRELPLAAETSGAKGALEVLIVRRANGAWGAQYPDGQRVTLGSAEPLGEEDQQRLGALVLPLGRPVTFARAPEGGAAPFAVYRFGVALEPTNEQVSRATVRPTRVGEFAIRSGPDHVGSARVVPADEFDAWLAGSFVPPRVGAADETPAQRGRQLFLRLQCANCHSGRADARAPSLEALYGSKVTLKGGAETTADEAYLVESIRKPKAKVVAGWEPIMPAYDETQTTAEEVNALVAYLKSLKKGAAPKEDRFPPPVGAPPVNERLQPVPRVTGPFAEPRLEPLRVKEAGNAPELHPQDMRPEDAAAMRKRLIERGFDPASAYELFPLPVAPPPREKK